MAELEPTFIPSLYKPSSLLPIARHRESLLYTIEQSPVTVVIGQTGSGKTTQLPQFLDSAGWSADGKIIGVTQVGEKACRRSYRLGEDLTLFILSRELAAAGCCCDGSEQSGRGDAMQCRG
jgi:predicted ATPase